MQNPTMKQTLQVPVYWGMFTEAGNRSLHAKAYKLLNDVEYAEANEQKERTALERFFGDYCKMWDSKTMAEASDTAVRELVMGFAGIVARYTKVNEQEVEEIYEDAAWG